MPTRADPEALSVSGNVRGAAFREFAMSILDALLDGVRTRFGPTTDGRSKSDPGESRRDGNHAEPGPEEVVQPPSALQAHLGVSSLWLADESLSLIRDGAWLERGAPLVVSLDIFDTVLFRRCATPADVFMVLGERLAALGSLPKGMTSGQFAELRKLAERKTREVFHSRAGTREVTINQIYASLVTSQDVSLSAEDLIALELETEKKLCFLNPAMLSLIRDLTSAGKQVAFISDTYWSESQLLDLLGSCSVPYVTPDHVFSSGDRRVGKYTGDLFKLVLRKLSLDPHELAHVGDNYDSDCAGAGMAGVQSCHYYPGNEYTAMVSFREERTSGKHVLSDAGGIASLRVLAQRLCADRTADEKPFFRCGAYVLGPVLAAYADWCVQQFSEFGVTKVLSLMREGEFLADLTSNAASAVDYDIDIIPCYVSRQATAIAGVETVNERTLRKALWRREPPSVAQFCSTFGIEPELLGFAESDESANLDDDALIKSTIERMLHEPVKARIGWLASEARSLIVSYVKQLVGGDLPTRIGLIDIGWNGTIQGNLQKALDSTRRSSRLVGCYLGTSIDAVSLLLEHHVIRSFLCGAGVNPWAIEPLVRSPEILEQSLSARVGTTVGYQQHADSVVRPVLEECRLDDLEWRKKKALQDGIATFQHLWLEVFGQSGQQPGEGLPASDALARILARLIEWPTGDEAYHLGSLHHDDNFGSSSWRPITDDYAHGKFHAAGVAGLFADSKVYWPQGTLGRLDPGLLARLYSLARVDELAAATPRQTAMARPKPRPLWHLPWRVAQFLWTDGPTVVVSKGAQYLRARQRHARLQRLATDEAVPSQRRAATSRLESRLQGLAGRWALSSGAVRFLHETWELLRAQRRL